MFALFVALISLFPMRPLLSFSLHILLIELDGLKESFLYVYFSGCDLAQMTFPWNLSVCPPFLRHRVLRSPLFNFGDERFWADLPNFFLTNVYSPCP